MLTKAELPECPVATTVQLIGNKWKLLILRNLLARPWRFNELLKSIPGLSQKVLTDNLRAMEKDGIITRTVYPEVPPRVEYALSELGESMRPIIKALEVWGTDENPSFEVNAALLHHQGAGSLGHRLSGACAQRMKKTVSAQYGGRFFLLLYCSAGNRKPAVISR